MFTIQGTPDSNEKALFLLYNQVCAHLFSFGLEATALFADLTPSYQQLETEKERRQASGTAISGEPST